MKHKFKVAFVPNFSPKYDMSTINELADNVIYASESPVYDAQMDDKKAIADNVGRGMDIYNPKTDVIVDSGDPVILAMMIAYVSEFHEGFYFARYNSRANKYVVTRISKLEMNPDLEDYFGGEEVYDD